MSYDPALGAPMPPGGDPTDEQATKRWIVRVSRVVVSFIYVIVAVCLAFLVTGFVLRVFGASTDAAFTRWVYRNVDRIMEPFRGIFPSRALNDRSVVDFSLLFAMVVYAIAAIGLHALVAWLARVAATAEAAAPSPARPRRR